MPSSPLILYTTRKLAMKTKAERDQVFAGIYECLNEGKLAALTALDAAQQLEKLSKPKRRRRKSKS